MEKEDILKLLDAEAKPYLKDKSVTGLKIVLMLDRLRIQVNANS